MKKKKKKRKEKKKTLTQLRLTNYILIYFKFNELERYFQ